MPFDRPFGGGCWNGEACWKGRKNEEGEGLLGALAFCCSLFFFAFLGILFCSAEGLKLVSLDCSLIAASLY